MANYFSPDKYSLLDNPQFQTQFSGPGQQIQAQPAQQVTQQSDPLLSPDVARATAYGGQAGGLSGALTSGGVASVLGPAGMAGGGPYAIAGGLILSQIEAAQKAKAEAEKQKIQDEKDRQSKLSNVYARMANQQFGV